MWGEQMEKDLDSPMARKIDQHFHKVADQIKSNNTNHRRLIVSAKGSVESFKIPFVRETDWSPMLFIFYRRRGVNDHSYINERLR